MITVLIVKIVPIKMPQATTPEALELTSKGGVPLWN
jgi:hypothetical protein